MELKYPISMKADGEGYVVTFKDVPEAITEGDNLDHALAMAKDCLETALEFYKDSGRPYPLPSEIGPGQYFVPVDVA